ncbi:hypothetical protein D3C86_1285780 [compost metagenome]
MTGNHSKQIVEVIAVADDGTTYRLERRCQILRAEEEPSFFYCCLPDGQHVDWLGSGQYRLPDGTIVRVAASRLRHE